ncbi:hypothetical protein IMT09_16710 [Burkholderia cepacia]|uniref:hypothetical protein n=1 Tax=Burkholderia cepacia TaxID=292 RepID=UPI0018665725|nr:hypothetical protein [Burkholderia cepacia]MBE2969731.1 hypothetical protein [Burkholderia cepacia]
MAQRNADAAPARARIGVDRDAAAAERGADRIGTRISTSTSTSISIAIAIAIARRSNPSMLTANWRRAVVNLATPPASHHKARACNRTEDSVALCYLGSPLIGH